MPGTIRLGALLALLAVAMALPGCGSDEVSGEIPADNAADLNSALASVRENIETIPPDCAEAADQADEFVDAVNQLPLDAGEELKAELRAAGDNLRTLVSDECTSTGTTTTTEPPPTSSTTEETESTTTDETTATTTTTDETPPDENGGGPPGGGPPGGGPPGGGPPGQDGGTGGTGSGSGDETDE
jgi:hypothetical protein